MTVGLVELKDRSVVSFEIFELLKQSDVQVLSKIISAQSVNDENSWYVRRGLQRELYLIS